MFKTVANVANITNVTNVAIVAKVANVVFFLITTHFLFLQPIIYYFYCPSFNLVLANTSFETC